MGERVRGTSPQFEISLFAFIVTDSFSLVSMVFIIYLFVCFSWAEKNIIKHDSVQKSDIFFISYCADIFCVHTKRERERERLVRHFARSFLSSSGGVNPNRRSSVAAKFSFFHLFLLLPMRASTQQDPD